MIEFQKGKKISFEILLQKFYPRILNFIYRYVGSRQTAEDLTQEVFIKVYHSAASYKPQSKFQTWIYTIAKNISLNELRRLSRPMVHLDQSVPHQDGETKFQLEDTRAAAPGDDLLAKEKTDVIRNAVAQLPEHQRTAVILRRYEDFSYEEIAKAMNTSVKAVKSLLSRAKANLRIKLSHLIKGQ